jgi:hypothetical protein
LDLPNGYPEEVLKATESMKIPEIVIEKEKPRTE